MKKILFVCTGNTCRSSMAEALFKNMLQEHGITDIEVSSAGIAVLFPSGANEHAVAVMNDLDIDLSLHQAKQITKEMIQDAHLILTMTITHRENILSRYPQVADKTFTLKEFACDEASRNDLNISDPFGLPKECYERCSREIYSLLEKVIKKLKRDEA